MQEMVIYGISFDMVGRQPIVLLKTVAGNRFLPIWIGHPEAAAILMRLQGADAPRPGTHDVLVSAIEQLDAEIARVAITELQDKTFLAEIVLTDDGGSEQVLDSRPSDALAVAVRVEAPILAADEVIEENGIDFEPGSAAEKETMVEDFRRFLEDVDPGDFASDS